MSSKNEHFIRKVASDVRKELVEKYEDEFLAGKCIEACRIIMDRFGKMGIEAKEIDAWCLYDMAEGIAGEPCAPHVYVLAEGLYVDVTATQFAPWLNTNIKSVIVESEIPYWIRSSKPSLEEMEERGY